MKKLSVLGVLVVMWFSMAGCGQDNRGKLLLDEVKGFYEDPHEIRKMFVKDEEMTIKEPGRGHFSGGFFLFMGGVSGDYKEGTEIKQVVNNVRFAWEIKDKTYSITTLPLEKIRIKLVEKGEPTVSFFLNAFTINECFRVGNYVFPIYKDQEESSGVGRILRNYYNPSETFTRYLEYAVFTVKSEDWPVNINLPVNQDYSK